VLLELDVTDTVSARSGRAPHNPRVLALDGDQAEPPKRAGTRDMPQVRIREGEPDCVDVALPALHLANSTAPVVQLRLHGTHGEQALTRSEAQSECVALTT
jgi:hypothetical protein